MNTLTPNWPCWQKNDVHKLSENEIVSLHRFPARPDKIPSIIVRFSQNSTRLWLDKMKRLNRKERNGYILENMTWENRALLWTTKEWAKDNDFLYSWHRNRKIFLRRKEGDQLLSSARQTCNVWPEKFWVFYCSSFRNSRTNLFYWIWTKVLFWEWAFGFFEVHSFKYSVRPI